MISWMTLSQDLLMISDWCYSIHIGRKSADMESLISRIIPRYPGRSEWNEPWKISRWSDTIKHRRQGVDILKTSSLPSNREHRSSNLKWAIKLFLKWKLLIAKTGKCDPNRMWRQSCVQPTGSVTSLLLVSFACNYVSVYSASIPSDLHLKTLPLGKICRCSFSKATNHWCIFNRTRKPAREFKIWSI